MSITLAMFFLGYLTVALYFTGKNMQKKGYIQGITDTLSNIEEALDNDEKKIEALYRIIARNKGMKIQISYDES